MTGAKLQKIKRIHQALRKTLSHIIGQDLQSLNENINAHRGLPSTVDSQAADLWRLISEKIPGTCKWLDQNANYDRWITTKDDALLYIRGPPAAGKSFLAAHVVDKLRGGPNNVYYYFFVKGDKSRTSVSSFLQSMASQIASAVPEVAKLIDDMLQDEPELARAVDHSIIWRKLWLDGILRLKLDTAPKLTWMIDSLDECQADVALSKLLIHLCEKRFARILVTAKADHHTYHMIPRLVNSLDIRIEDTQTDISAYLDQQLNSSETRLRNGILAKSNGCFLWAPLVIRQLENVHGLELRLQAIQSEPPGMQDLYANISMSLPDHQLSTAGANDGTIKLYDFETLRVVYTIRSEDHAITALAFNHDSVRLFDIRGNGRSCRVWEPAALLRREIETESIRSPSTYSRDNHEDVIDRNDDNDSIVTALACHKEGRYIVGKNDATVCRVDTGWIEGPVRSRIHWI